MPKQELSAAEVAALTKPGFHRVGPIPLYLQIRPGGTRSWLLRFQLRGKNHWLGLGAAKTGQVSLTEARRRAIRAQAQVHAGENPIETRGRRRKRMTFGDAVDQYLKAHSAGWKNAKHRQQWENTLKKDAASLAKLPVDAIETADVLAVLKPIWSVKPETAGRLRGRIERVLDWARASGYRAGANPARWKGGLSHLLPPLASVQTVRHHPAMPALPFASQAAHSSPSIRDATGSRRSVVLRRPNDGCAAA